MTPPNNDELRRHAVQTVAHMVADGMKSGAFMDWTTANDIANRYEEYIATHDQQLLEAILEGADYGVCTGGEWSNEKKQFVCDHDHSGIVPVEHIKSVFNQKSE